jgi:flagellar motor switch protein FliG
VDEGVTTISGRRKAAILCVSLGPVGAAEVFKHLPEELIEKLTVEMARLPEVKPEHAERVHEEVVESAYARGYIAQGGVRFAREVLERAYGEGRASEILGRLASVIESTPFEFLRQTPPEQIVAFLGGEHVQTTALVIANLPTTELAAKVMQLIPAADQADIALRIALMGQTPPDVVKEVASVMSDRLQNVTQQEYNAVGGVKSLAEILNNSDRPTERNILEHLAEENPELAEEVRALLFVFEDLLKLDDRSVQLVLKEVDAKDLALALRGASDDVKERIMANMSQRGAEMLREEMEFMPPQRRRVVEEAQSKIVGVVRKLEDSGAIFIQRAGAGEDEMVL